MASTQDPLPATCPSCGSQRVVGGRIMAFGAHAANAQRFFPDGLKLLTLRRGLVLERRHQVTACTDCGHVWSRVDAGALREMVQTSGGEALRDVLRRSGPTRGGPG
jgi:DNA-directed RNA polymerase subunit RPC12/RpoP